MASQTKKALLVENFNLKYPVGTPVRFWTGIRDGEGRVGEVKYAADLIGDTPGAWISGGIGFVALTHIEPIKREATHG